MIDRRTSLIGGKHGKADDGYQGAGRLHRNQATDDQESNFPGEISNTDEEDRQAPQVGPARRGPVSRQVATDKLIDRTAQSAIIPPYNRQRR